MKHVVLVEACRGGEACRGSLLETEYFIESTESDVDHGRALTSKNSSTQRLVFKITRIWDGAFSGARADTAVPGGAACARPRGGTGKGEEKNGLRKIAVRTVTTNLHHSATPTVGLCSIYAGVGVEFVI